MSIQLRSGSEGASETPNPTNVGGQAVIEGVLMRAPGSLAIVCRRRDGRMVVRERTVEAPASGLAKLPFFRGVHTLVSSLRLGHQALMWSAQLMEEDLEAEEGKAKAAPPGGTSTLSLSTLSLSTLGSIPASAWALAVAAPVLHGGDAEGGDRKSGGVLMFVPLLFAVFLFIALPQLAAEAANAWMNLDLGVTSPGFQAITGACKLTIIIGYLSLIRLMPDVRRVFQYHGAEHKAISTYEKGQELVVENARATTALHARCGTTFIIMVAFVSVILFSLAGAFLPPIPGPRVAQSLLFFLMKLPLLPVIAGLTYELQRVFARYCSTGPLQVLLWPGFLVQKITTAEPDDTQLEVALASLRAALARASVRLPDDHPDRTFPSYGSLVDDPSYRVAS